MPVIIIDGPEKAGKTTIINSLVEQFYIMGIEAERVHWGLISPDDRVYAEPLKKHTSDKRKVWLWDRGWASEFVYNRLLGRDRRMNKDPWIGEWLHGRAVQTGGLRIILTGPNSGELARLRDESDMDVSPSIEQALFKMYGRQFGWTVIENEHTPSSLLHVVGDIMMKFMSKRVPTTSPQDWCGPQDAKVVVIGEKLSSKTIPGGWLPFTSNFTTLLGREFSDDAFKVAWTNSNSCDPEWLRGIETVITCGKIADKWFEKNRKEVPAKYITIPHPSYLYRFKNGKTKDKLQVVRQLIDSLKPL